MVDLLPEGRKNFLIDARIPEGREATRIIPDIGMSLPLTDSGRGQAGAQGQGAGAQSRGRVRTTTGATESTRRGKTAIQVAATGKMRDVMEEEDREEMKGGPTSSINPTKLVDRNNSVISIPLYIYR